MPRKTVVSVLLKARSLISGGWTQGEEAVDVDGESVFDPKSPDAAAFCSIGGVRAADGDLFNKTILALAETIKGGPLDTKIVPCIFGLKDHEHFENDDSNPENILAEWNDADERTKRQVLGLFTRTINRLQKKRGGRKS